MGIDKVGIDKVGINLTLYCLLATMGIGEVERGDRAREGGKRGKRRGESTTLFSLTYTTLFCGADVDECSEDDTLCKEGTYCFNTPGSYKCYSEICLTSSAM